MAKTTISRRSILRGVLGGTGISVALPPLDAMFNSNGTAYAQGAPLPRRLGIFFWGNGVRLAKWTPATIGAGWTPNEELMPLAPLRDYVSVVSGMSLKTGNERAHHSGAVGILSGAPLIAEPHPNSNYVSTFSAPTIDQVAATELGKTTRFRSLEVGISRRVVKVEGTTLWYLSHNGPDNVNPPEYDPAKVFSRLFGAGFQAPSSQPVLDVTRALRRSVLDAVLDDLGSLRTRVGTRDKQRLDQHAQNIRDIEARLQNIPPPVPVSAGCALPTNPGSFPDLNRNEQIEPLMKAMGGLIAMALACDQTRVFSVMFSGSVGSTVFWPVNVTTGHHDLTHNETGDQPQVHATTVYTMQMFATLLQALKDMPEGAGNVLDSCAILGTTDVAQGLEHSITDYPILVAGRAGGALKSPSVHYRSKAENTSMVLLTLLRAVGLPLTTFGMGGGLVTAGCTAIEA